MVHHVLGLFTHPDQEWQEIRGEEETISHMYLTHILVLAAIPAVSAYIGTTQVGWAIGDRAPVMLTEASALQLSIMSYLAMLAGVAVMAAVVHWMARTYDAAPSMAQSVVFAAYAATPLFVGGLAALVGVVSGTGACGGEVSTVGADVSSCADSVVASVGEGGATCASSVTSVGAAGVSSAGTAAVGKASVGSAVARSTVAGSTVAREGAASVGGRAASAVSATVSGAALDGGACVGSAGGEWGGGKSASVFAPASGSTSTGASIAGNRASSPATRG